MDRRKSNASRALITPEGKYGTAAQACAPPRRAAVYRAGQVAVRPARARGLHRVPSAPPPAWPARGGLPAAPHRTVDGRAGDQDDEWFHRHRRHRLTRADGPTTLKRPAIHAGPGATSTYPASTPGRPPNTDVNEKPITSRIRRFARARGRAPAGNPAGRPRRVRDRRAWDRPRSRRRHGISSARPVSRWIRRRVP